MSNINQDKIKVQGGCTFWARKTIDSDIFSKPDKWFKIWFYIVNRVSYMANGQFGRGQCFLKYETIMLQCRATKSEVDHCIRWLKKNQMLATRRATRGFIVTVCNYDYYQNIDSYKSDRSGDAKATQGRHDNKEGKESKEYSPNSDEFRLAQLLLDLIVQRKQNFRKPNVQKWAVHIDRLIRLDKRSLAQIEAVISWCQQDDFWKNNILSTDKLRKQIDKLELAMEKDNNQEIINPLEVGSDGLTPREHLRMKLEKEKQQKTTTTGKIQEHANTTN
ncbi:MAG: hypothetical protein GY845_20530 [Planctomycetes bacterium]|nr:hypothetical protein [Planctomycetota bacterium]